MQPRGWKLPFFTLWIGQAFSLFGSSLVQFALVWWLTAKTGSATVLALATLLALLPQVVLGLVAGALVDRWSRRAVMLVADSAIALATVGLALRFAGGAAGVGDVCLVILVRSAATAFHWPAMEASTALMVPPRHLARVAGLNQTLSGVVSIVSPPLAALLYSALPLPTILGIDIGTALIAIIPLLFIAVPRPERQTAPAEGSTAAGASVWREMRDGFRYIAAWRGLMAVIGLGLIVNFLLEPLFSLVPILVTNHFGGAAVELGWLESAWGVGILTGGVALSVWGGFKRRVVTSLIGVMGLGLGILVLGAAPATALWLGMVGVFLAGFTTPIASGPLLAIVQAMVAPDMQGRVLSTLGAATAAVAPVGLLVIGPLADVTGARLPYIVGGAALALVGLGGFFISPLMHIEDNRRAAGGEPARDEVAAAQP